MSRPFVWSIATGYNTTVSTLAKTSTKNGHAKPRVSKLGKDLQKLRDKYVSSGGKLLNRRELEQEIAERRGQR
jgi:hypothetical protein